MNKKGFTLIELLAVILVLGIVALIAIPQVTKIITEAKRGAFNTTVHNLKEAIEKQCTLDMLRGNKPGKTYTLQNGKLNESIEIKGTLPNSGTIVVNNDCSVSEINVTDGELASSLVNDEVVTKKLSEFPGLAIYYDPVANNVCTKEDEDKNRNEIGTKTGVKGGCMKWYVVEAKDNSDDAVDVILDHNAIALLAYDANGKKEYNGSTIETAVNNLIVVDGWDEVLKPRLLRGSEVAAIVGADREDTIKWSDEQKFSSSPVIGTLSGMFYLDGMKNSNKKSYSTTNGWQKQWAGTSLGYNGLSEYYWLYDYTKLCIEYGCSVEEPNNAAVKNIGYWLYNVPENTIAIEVYGRLNSKASNTTGNYGLRPVISIPKSKLQ